MDCFWLANVPLHRLYLEKWAEEFCRVSRVNTEKLWVSLAVSVGWWFCCHLHTVIWREMGEKSTKSSITPYKQESSFNTLRQNCPFGRASVGPKMGQMMSQGQSQNCLSFSVWRERRLKQKTTTPGLVEKERKKTFDVSYFSVSHNALEFSPDFFGLCQVHLTNWKTNLANGVVFGKAVVVVHGENEGLGHHLPIWNLEAKLQGVLLSFEPRFQD